MNTWTLVGGPADGQKVQLRDGQTWLTVIVRTATIDPMNPFGPRGVPTHVSVPYEEHKYERESPDAGPVLAYVGTVMAAGLPAAAVELEPEQDVPASLLERFRIKIKRGNVNGRGRRA